MRKLRLLLVGLLAASPLVLSAAPASADSCPYGKAGCLVYYQACKVAAEAGIQCID